MKLVLASNNQILFSNLEIADNMISRAIGLLKYKTLPETEAILFRRCNSIHTYFMRFSIDVVMLDSNGKIVSIIENVKPNRFVWPRWKAKDTIEMAAGLIRKLGIRQGDTLHVVS
jgi:uncharacterized membrane protein (UPF0127 family)